MCAQEIELKLRLAPEEARRLRRDRTVHRLKRGRAGNQRLIAVYFDSPALALRDARIALRLRQEGARRVQTVKCPIGPASGGMQRRLEVEAPIAGREPDLSLIDDAQVAARVRAALGGAAPVPIFSTDVKRTTWLLAVGKSTVELALDTGEIASERAGATCVPIAEAELELKSGDPADLLAFADDLRQRIAFRIGGESKAARGYALHLGETPTPTKAAEPALDPAMSAREALGVILSDGVAQLLANEAVVEDGTDPEGVHQARVAVRRTRAALSAFKPVIERGPRKPLARKLRWLQQALGPARDWDVFLEETLGPVLKAAPESEGLRGLEKRSAKRRTKGYKQALKAIHSKRYQRLLIALEGWVFTDNPDAERRAVGGFAQDLLEARYRAVLTDGGADPTALPTEALHRLRIEIKKLRYAVEFFRSLYAPDEVAGFLQAVKKLQDCLGGLNDAVVAHRLLQDLAGGAEDPARVLDADAVRAIEAAQAEKIETGLAKLSAMWARFGEQPVFWESAAEAPPVSPAPAGARSG